jgi:hypothetical protein
MAILVAVMSGEPADFDPRALAQWLAKRGQTYRTPRQAPGPRPTLAQLRERHSWLWVWCERCHHHAPMALVPFIIRWGPGRVERSAASVRTLHGVRRQGRYAATSRLGRSAGRVSALPEQIEQSAP